MAMFIKIAATDFNVSQRTSSSQLEGSTQHQFESHLQSMHANHCHITCKYTSECHASMPAYLHASVPHAHMPAWHAWWHAWWYAWPKACRGENTPCMHAYRHTSVPCYAGKTCPPYLHGMQADMPCHAGIPCHAMKAAGIPCVQTCHARRHAI